MGRAEGVPEAACLLQCARPDPGKWVRKPERDARPLGRTGRGRRGPTEQSRREGREGRMEGGPREDQHAVPRSRPSPPLSRGAAAALFPAVSALGTEAKAAGKREQGASLLFSERKKRA